jgi:surface antigen
MAKPLAFKAPRRARPRPRYKGRRQARLWRLRANAIALSIVLGLATGGCSMSYKLDSFLGRTGEDKPEHTATVRTAPAAATPGDAAAARTDDLAYAKAAAAEVLTRTEPNASQPWENPGTGARGTVTPIASSYSQDGFTCRDFLASYVRDGTESWLQGDACRIHQGKWTVRSLRPLKRS